MRNIINHLNRIWYNRAIWMSADGLQMRWLFCLLSYKELSSRNYPNQQIFYALTSAMPELKSPICKVLYQFYYKCWNASFSVCFFIKHLLTFYSYLCITNVPAMCLILHHPNIILPAHSFLLGHYLLLHCCSDPSLVLSVEDRPVKVSFPIVIGIASCCLTQGSDPGLPPNSSIQA